MTSELPAFRLPLSPLDATYCRAVREIHPPLDTTGARLFGGRFNPPGVPALYLAEDPDLALRESTRSADWAAYQAFAPRRIVCIPLRLSRVVDLCDSTVLVASGLAQADLTSDWASAQSPSPAQLFGESALLGGVEGIVYPSAMDGTRSNIAVFGDNLLLGSRLQLIGEE